LPPQSDCASRRHRHDGGKQGISFAAAQIVKVQDGNELTEEISSFLPMGKAINATLLVKILQDLNIDMDMVE
jgi:hypothetical protein